MKLKYNHLNCIAACTCLDRFFITDQELSNADWFYKCPYCEAKFHVPHKKAAAADKLTCHIVNKHKLGQVILINFALLKNHSEDLNNIPKMTEARWSIDRLPDSYTQIGESGV